MNQFCSLNDSMVVEKFENLVTIERKTTAEIVDCLKEIDRRQLYRLRGHMSLFAYLTAGLGYTPASAQRRIDAARLMKALPEIKTELESGSLNLMQVSMLSQSVRQKKKSEPGSFVSVAEKKEILDLIKDKKIDESQKIIAQALNIPFQQYENKKIQRDESVRLEITLTKKQMEQLARVKELVSNKNPNPTWAELIGVLAEAYIKRNDPLEKPFRTSKMEAAPNQSGRVRELQHRAVLQQDRCCQWKDPVTGKICGSKFQPQVDHKIPIWAGGTNDPGNLQQLCGFHNRLKYRLEAGIGPGET